MARRKRLRAVPALIALNVLIFLFEKLLDPAELENLFSLFALSYDGLEAGRWWQLVTHAFLHSSANVLHILANMLGLWFAGKIVERVMGTGRFLGLYFVSAVAGGLCQVALGGGAPLIGASGAVCGVILAFTTIFARREILVLLFFIIPLRLRARYLGWGLIGFSVAALMTRFEPQIGHAAHLGGAIAGYLFTRLSGYGEQTFFERRLFPRKKPQY